jgi:hypothetical protein
MTALNKELIMVTLPAISWFLFALGGTRIAEDNSIQGQKWIRRFLLPAVYSLYCFFLVDWLKASMVTAIAIPTFCLGYGIGKSYLYRFLVGCGYALISLPLGISWWNLVTAVGFIVVFKLANTQLTRKMFIWKICEGIFGLTIGIQLSYSLMGKGILFNF